MDVHGHLTMHYLPDVLYHPQAESSLQWVWGHNHITMDVHSHLCMQYHPWPDVLYHPNTMKSMSRSSQKMNMYKA